MIQINKSQFIPVNEEHRRALFNLKEEVMVMKKLTLTSAIFMALAATSVFAHHPSLDTNPNFTMVEEQLDAVDSPHLDMDVEMDIIGNMGGVDSTGAGIADANRATDGWNSTQTQTGEPLTDPEQAGSGPKASSVDTMGLFEDVGRALSD